SNSFKRCEENYLITPLIAEFWNATSNLFYIVGTLIGLYSVRSLGITESRTYLSLFSIALIGFGSFLFHASLWFETQMADELPMIYGSCVMVYANLRVFPETNKNNTLLGFGLFLYAATVTAMYLYLNNPVFHEVCYSVLALILFITPPIQFNHIKAKYPQYKNRVKGFWTLYWFGSVSYLSGFMIWGVDNNFCERVRAARESIGYPGRILLELHMWWHFGTALGTYASVINTTLLAAVGVGEERCLC
ncbi:ceramidase, partial [Obelidium mucronatum]